MPDYHVTLPDHFLSVQAFEPGRSRNRALAAALADLQEFAQPGRCANPQQHASDIYTAYAGADTPQNQTALSAANALDYLAQQGMNALDMAALLWGAADEQSLRTAGQAAGQSEETIAATIATAMEARQLALKHEIQAQNMNDVPQLLILATDSPLTSAATGQPLHNWSAPGVSQAAALIRVGFSTDVANAFYLDPALSAAFAQPVPVSWDEILKAGIAACIAVLPPGVPLPPADFHFAAGVDPTTGSTLANRWPVPKPEIDVTGALAQLQAMLTAGDALANVSAQLKDGAQRVMNSLKG